MKFTENKIEDTGDKFGGAKKDLRDKRLSDIDIENISANEFFALNTKDNNWKKPDYKSLAERYDPFLLTAVKNIRNSIASSPKPTLSYLAERNMTTEDKALYHYLVHRSYMLELSYIEDYFDLNNPDQTNAILTEKVINAQYLYIALQAVRRKLVLDFEKDPELGGRIAIFLNNVDNYNWSRFASGTDLEQTVGKRFTKKAYEGNMDIIYQIDNFCELAFADEKGRVLKTNVPEQYVKAKDHIVNYLYSMRGAAKEGDIVTKKLSSQKAYLVRFDGEKYYNFLTDDLKDALNEIAKKDLGIKNKNENKKEIDVSEDNVEKATNDETPLNAIVFARLRKKELEKQIKDTWTAPQLSRIKRIGFDWRKGRNITPQEFIDEFGFRGVEFGASLPNNEKQQMLNAAYDSFCDIAYILDIKDRKQLSLNGMGLAFGSRGDGGKYAAAAHFEGDLNVINLTRMNGAGSLMHEYFHAMDWYINQHPYGQYKKGEDNKLHQIFETFRNPMEKRSHEDMSRQAFKEQITANRRAVEKNEFSFDIFHKGHENSYINSLNSFKNDLVNEFKKIIDMEVKNHKDGELKSYSEIFLAFHQARDGEDIFTPQTYEYLNGIREELTKKINPSIGKWYLRNPSPFVMTFYKLLDKHYPYFFNRDIMGMYDNKKLFDKFKDSLVDYHLDVAKYLYAEENNIKFDCSFHFIERRQVKSTEYYANARKMDFLVPKKNDDGGYWSSNVELFARAGEAYVLSKMRQHGIVNDFLQSQKIHNGIDGVAYFYDIDNAVEGNGKVYAYPSEREVNDYVEPLYDTLLVNHMKMNPEIPFTDDARKEFIAQKEEYYKKQGYEIVETVSELKAIKTRSKAKNAVAEINKQNISANDDRSAPEYKDAPTEQLGFGF